ncbi:MAG: oxaloacetate decarboxylase [Paludibacteraceae bacterium]|nr:oxaloacetate decarboxylase [Paludibacteraceae bacterium]MBP6283970.1 oxaloacetate decarboxylase [Paludibacteraceae bacterium]
MENLYEGFLLLVVGISSVFFVLVLVMATSKGLILLVNRYFPEKDTISKQALVQTSAQLVIGEVIKQMSNGKLTVKNIEKLK